MTRFLLFCAILLAANTAFLTPPASAQTTFGILTSEELEKVGISSVKTEHPGGTVLIDNEAGTLKLAYDDEWRSIIAFVDTTHYKVKVGDSEEIEIRNSVIGNTDPVFVSYQEGVMSAGAVYELVAKKTGWMTVFLRMNPQRQYVVFEGKTKGIPYTLGMKNRHYWINYSLPTQLSGENAGGINFNAPDASKYFIEDKLPQFPYIVADRIGDSDTYIAATGFLTFRVKEGFTYYFSALGSKVACGGFGFTESNSEPNVTFCENEVLSKMQFRTGLPPFDFLSATDDFEYEGIWYTIIDKESKTCKTKEGWDNQNDPFIQGINKAPALPGNVWKGELIIPATVVADGIEYTVKEIGKFSFANNQELTSVTLPPTVSYIDKNAFSNCGALTSLYFPDDIEGIGTESFSGCKELSNVKWPKKLIYFRAFGFEGCTKLTSVELYQDLLLMDYGVFSGCKGISEVTYYSPNPISVGDETFEKVVYNNAILKMPDTPMERIAGISPWNRFSHIQPAKEFESEGLVYTVIDEEKRTCKTRCGWRESTSESQQGLDRIQIAGNTVSDSLVIPSRVSDGSTEYKVIGIGSYGFYQCESLSSIVFPESLTFIDDYAFYKDQNISEINLPDSLISIGKSAFETYNISITDLQLPNSTEYIGDSAFMGWHGVKNLYLPSSLSYIGNTAFLGLSALKSITYSASVPIEASANSFDEINYDNALLNVPNASLADVQSTQPWNRFIRIKAKDASVAPPLVAGENFEYNGIWYTVIDSEIKTCKTKDGYWDNGDEIAGNNVSGNIVIPSIVSDGLNDYTVTAVGSFGFYKCEELTSIVLPESVTSIGANAFAYCLNLASIDIPDGVTTIGNSTFYGCLLLTSINIPKGVTSIGEFAFSDCSSLQSINISEGVTSIGGNAFSGCSNLTSINIPSGVSSIEDFTFYGCLSLTSIKIPEGVTSIGDLSFHGCSSLTSITLPEGVTSIGEATFYGCTSLTSISIPEGMTSIGEQAFQFCTSLASINIPNGVTSIGAYSFSNCSNLASINISGSVNSIYNQAFYNSNNIKDITYTAIDPIEAPEDIFGSSIYDNAILNTPNATLVSVQATVPWNLFKRIVASDGTSGFVSAGDDFEYEGIWYTVIDPEAKTAKTKDNGNQGKGNLVIPSLASDGNEQYSVTEIGEGGFSGSSELLSITLPSTITSIGTNAFADCERLTSFVWTVHSRLDRQVLDEIANPNLLLYVDSLQYSPQGINDNVVAYGKCNSLNLTPGYPFTPLSAFTALSSRMEKRFTQQTAIDGCAGWETIVLPFDATSVYAENLDSELIPFGLITDIYDQHPYWLYQADAHGEWKHAYGIQACVPYIISTPNNPAYPDFYNVDGTVVFSSSEAQRIAPATTAPYAVTWASGREFRSLWLPLSESEAADAMGLNVGISDLMEDGEYLAPGSAFHVDVLPKPLEAYVTRLGAERAMKVIGSQSGVLPLVAKDGLKISQDGGTVKLQSSHDMNIEIFSVDGTLLRNVTLKAGEAVVVESLPQGVCIISGQKLLIK